MGDTANRPFQFSFNPALKIEFQGSRVTSDGGLVLVRELDERLGLSDLIAQHLTDPRGTNTQFPFADMVRQSVYRRLAGYEDVNDAEPLAHDPTFRLIGSETIWERGAALTSRVHSFETDLLTRDENLAGLAALNRELIAQVEAMASPQRVVIDLDSTEIPVYGEQEQSAYNGHFESTCYQPLLLFNREGDCLAAKLRPGNVHSAADWDGVLLPEIERQRRQGKDVVVRADAAFAKPEIYEALEGRDVKYAIRIPSNDILEREVAELLTRPVGRPSHKPVVRYKSIRYQAVSWERARRVVAKIEFHCGELFPRVGFVVTTLETDSRAVVRFSHEGACQVPRSPPRSGSASCRNLLSAIRAWSFYHWRLVMVPSAHYDSTHGSLIYNRGPDAPEPHRGQPGSHSLVIGARFFYAEARFS